MKKILLTAALGLLVNGGTAIAGGDITTTAVAPMVDAKVVVNDSQKPLIKPKISLEKAQSIAEKMFAITKDYKRDMANYEDSPERKVWSFNWSKNTSGAYSNINVSIDADTGEIRNYYYNDSTMYQPIYDFASAFTREEAHAVALKALKKYIPIRFSSLKEVDVPQYGNVIYGKREMQRYQFRFVRMVKGIPFEDDAAWITVSEKGQILDYNLNWTPIGDQLALAKITKTQAEQTFRDQVGLQLAYVKDYSSPNQDKVNLVYQVPELFANFYIDAETGEVKNYSGIIYAQGGMGKGEGMNVGAVTDKFYIADAKVAEEDAEAKVAEIIGIPDGYKVVAREFRNDYVSKRNMWYLRYNNPDANGSEIGVGVAADNGDILEMNKYINYPVETAKNEKEKLTYDQGLAKVDAFINKVAPDKLKYVKLDPPQEEMLKPEFIRYNTSMWFHYTRQVNGIPVIGEGLSASVDINTGEVINFRQDFSVNIKFPELKNILPQEKMLAKFFKNPGLKLTYFRTYPQPYQGVSRQVYVNLGYRMSQDAPRTFNVTTGEPIYNEWQKPQVKKTYPKDIAGTLYADAIKKVVDLGLMGGRTKTAFYPKAAVTKVEFIKALLAAKGYVPDYSAVKLPYKDVPAKAWYTPYLRMALKQGLITSAKTFEPLAPLTREEASKMITRALGFGKLAEFKIYKKPLGYGFVNTSYGFIAIAENFKIFPEQQRNYGSTVTRGESAKMLLTILSTNTTK